MPFIEPPSFMTADQAAKVLGGKASGRTVIRLILKGELKGKKVGHGWRILPVWLEEYMNVPDEIKKEGEYVQDHSGVQEPRGAGI